MKSLYPEGDLIALLLKQDRHAFNYLYDNYSAPLYGVVLQIVKKEDASHDLLQDVFVKIWKNVARYDAGKGRLFTWMLHVARNTCFDYLRKQNPETLDVSKVGDMIEANQNLFPGIENNDLKELVMLLGKEHKAVIELVYWEGYTHEETACRLELPLGTVKTRIRKALNKLRFSFENTLRQPMPVLN